ncbi:MAG: pilus assembly FimT family protein [Geminicoccaceae bacterium]
MRIRTSPAGDNRGERGFTLLELLVVIAIIGLMVALIPGFLLRDNKGLDLDRATRAVAEGLLDVRSAAITQNRDQLFGLDVERRQFLPGEGATPVQLNRGIQLRFVTARRQQLTESIGQIRFFPDGSSSGGSVQLDLGDLTSRIEVDWLTGQVKVVDDAS